jgi:hypothetical protein
MPAAIVKSEGGGNTTGKGPSGDGAPCEGRMVLQPAKNKLNTTTQNGPGNAVLAFVRMLQIMQNPQCSLVVDATSHSRWPLCLPE